MHPSPAATSAMRCAAIPSLILALPLIGSPGVIVHGNLVAMPLSGQSAASAPEGFTSTGNGAPAEWTLVQEATIHDGVAAANVAVTVRFKAIDGAVDGAAGTEVSTVADRTFTDAGKVALWTKGDSVTRFAALRIEAPQ